MAKQTLIIAGIAFFIITTVTIPLVIALCRRKEKHYYYLLSEHKYEYSIMMDAGSTSTKIYSYQFPKRTDKSLPGIEQKASFDKDPGVGEQLNLTEYFLDIFDKEKVIINNISNFKAYFKEVPVFLKATAGVRKLSEDEQGKKMSEINNIFKQYSPFLYEDDWAKVISGIEESYFGWAASNYITGVLRKNDDARDYIEETQGSLDMGGASFEISFVPKNNDTTPNVKDLNLGHLSYDLYSNSIQLGQDSALEILNDYAVKKNNNKNPCYFKGWTEEYKNTNITGTGNFTECNYLVNTLYTDLEKNYSSIKISSNYKFLATSGYSFAANMAGVPNDKYSSPNDELEKAKIFCNKTIEEIRASKPTDKEKYYKKYCFYCVYHYFVLTKIYKFDPSIQNLKYTNKVNGFTPSWALGAMIYEAGLLPFSD